MKVISMKDTKRVEVGTMKPGDTYLFKGNLFMVANVEGSVTNADETLVINVRTGYGNYIKRSTMVDSIEATTRY